MPVAYSLAPHWLLDLWLNMSARFVWEARALIANITDTTTIPTITDDQFSIPADCHAMIALVYSADAAYANEIDVPFIQEGTKIKMKISDMTPTRMVYHTTYTEVTAGNSFPTYIWDYLIIEFAAKLGQPIKKDQTEVILSQADPMLNRFWNSFSIRKLNFNLHHAPDGVVANKTNDLYTAGEVDK